MTIHKEGYLTIPITLLLLAAALTPFIWWLGCTSIWVWALAAIGAIFFFLVVSFFRSPKRSTHAQAQEILAPADGEVVVIERVMETEYFNDERIQLSIFMSPLNVHVNWNPVSGKVSYTKYHKGKFLVAWHPKSSELNERSTVVIKTEEYGEVLFRQIAGAVARRIRTYSKVGTSVEKGAQFGFIKFGSRVDVLLPVDVDLKVDVGQKVQGVNTVLATFTNKN